MVSPPNPDDSPLSETNPGLKATAEISFNHDSPNAGELIAKQLDTSLPALIDGQGRYTPIDRLGAGGFGVVLKAFDQELRRTVAVKLLHSASERGKVALLKEARTLANLDHPGIVPVYDVGRTPQGALFVVSKLITGQDLASFIHQDRPTLKESVQWTAAVADALDYAHLNHVVHRDVKPSNILLTADRVPVLSDFGLALEEANFGAGAAFVGTPAYMSPEQARYEGHRVDGRSDIYSLATVFFELLTGTRPFQATTRDELLELIRSVEPRPPRQIVRTIPREIERICLRALQKRATERYPVARDFADDLRHWLRACDAIESGQLPMSGSTSLIATGVAARSREDLAETESHGTSSHHPTPMVVPRGLRSFDEADADFFLSLLPGARDRDGLPDSVRFWKSHIEQTDAGETFRVAVLLSASGSGKSSLVRAGILPRLAKHIRSITLDASPHDLESRLLKRLQREFPWLSSATHLVEAMTQLRQRTSEQSPDKVLLVIDQFEQWLNADLNQPHSILSQALRQCDGSSLQALLLVRDDFTLAISQFMDELEEPLLQTRNFATVDSFSADHATKVLENFGRAYGIWSDEPSRENRRFIDQAVRDLGFQGRISPVQIAALTEIIKERPWTEATLKQLGGVRGIGVAFLEQRLAGERSHPELRQHLPMVRRILQALLPVDTDNIRGAAKTRSELLSAVGDQFPADRLDRLVMLLDIDARLITPVGSSSVSQSDSTSHTGSQDRETSYQLTHDYLVPSIRSWLTVGERATRRGRARLHLRQLAEYWAARPEKQRLPTFMEWLTLSLLTRTRDSLPNEIALMRSAKNHYLTRAGLLFCVLLSLSLIGYRFSQSRHAEASVARLLAADTSEVPSIVKELSSYPQSHQLCLTQLEDIDTTPPDVQDMASQRRRMHLHLGLAEHSPESAKYVIDHLESIPPEHLAAVAELLTPQQESLKQILWQRLTERPSTQFDPIGLASVGLLARFDRDHENWPQHFEWIARQLSLSRSSQLALWLKHFSGFGTELGEVCLALVGKEEEQLTSSQRGALFESIATLGETNPSVIVRGIEQAGVDEIGPLWTAAIQHRTEVVPELHARLDYWGNPGKQPNTANQANASFDDMLRRSGGTLLRDSAYVAACPLNQFDSLVSQMSLGQWTPVTVRPYPGESQIYVAAAFEPSSRLRRYRMGMDHGQVKESLGEISRSQGTVIDFAHYDLPKGDTSEELEGAYCLLWDTRPETGFASQCILGENESTFDGYAKQAADQGFVLQRRDQRLDAKGELVFDALWVSHLGPDKSAIDKSRYAYAFGELYPDRLLSDLRCHMVEARRADPFAATSLIREEQERLRGADDSDRASINQRLGRYYLAHGSPAQVIETLQHAGEKAWASRLRIAIALARLDKKDEVENIYRAFKDSNAPAQYRIPLDIYRNASSNDLEEVERQVEKYLTDESIPRDALFFQSLAMAIGAVAPINSAAALNWRNEWIKSFDRVLTEHSLLQPEVLLCDRDIDCLRSLPEYRDLLRRHHITRRYHSVWQEDPHLESHLALDLGSAAHLRRAKELASEGYQVVCVEARHEDASNELLISSVWHRRVRSSASKLAVAKHKARLTLALSRLGETDKLLHILSGADGIETQSQTLHLAAKWLEPAQLLELLTSTLPPETMRCLLLIAGQIPATQLPESLQKRAETKFMTLAQDETAAGMVSALRWCADQWKIELPVSTPNAQRTRGSAPRRTCYENSLGQWMIVVDPAPEFLMGSPFLEQDRNSREQLHWQEIGRRYSLSAHEVTVSLFREFLEDPKVKQAYGKRQFEYTERYAREPNCPQTSVRWVDAVRFCQWLSEREGLPADQWCYPDAWKANEADWKFPEDCLTRRGYRLPTEPEWEYACRGGSDCSRHFGDDVSLTAEYAWFVLNADEQTHPVGQKMPNAFGFFDMLGNCQEYCFGAYGSYKTPIDTYLYSDRVAVNDSLNKDEARVMRGGSFEHMPRQLRSADRASAKPTLNHFTNGFRIARTEP